MGMILTEQIFEFRVPFTKFGFDALLELGYDLVKFNIKSVLIVTDSYINTKTDFIEKAVSSIKNMGLEVDVWDGVEPEPSDASIRSGIDFARKKNYDGVVAIGGGSTIDTAKLIALCISYPYDFQDYFAPPVGKGLKIPGPLKKLIAVPTTSGTGSETTGTAVVSFLEKGMKYGITHEFLVPSMAILDPSLTLTMPPSIAASTGVDALMHAIEAYTARYYETRERPKIPAERPAYQGSSPLTDYLAEKSMELIGRYLRRSYANNLDRDARANMHLAAYLAGVAFSNAGVHLAHALALAFSSLMMERKVKVPHGVAAGLFGPAMLKILSKFYPEKCIAISRFLGYEPLNAGDALREFLGTLDFPSGLRSYGIDDKDKEKIVEIAILNKRLLSLSPITPTKELLSRIVEDSM